MKKVIRDNKYEKIVLESNHGRGVNVTRITENGDHEILLNDHEVKLLMNGLKDHFNENEWDF